MGMVGLFHDAYYTNAHDAMRRYVGQCCSVKRGTLLVEWGEAWSWRPKKNKKKRQHKYKNTQKKSPKRSGGSSAVIVHDLHESEA